MCHTQAHRHTHTHTHTLMCFSGRDRHTHTHTCAHTHTLTHTCTPTPIQVARAGSGRTRFANMTFASGRCEEGLQLWALCEEQRHRARGKVIIRAHSTHKQSAYTICTYLRHTHVHHVCTCMSAIAQDTVTDSPARQAAGRWPGSPTRPLWMRLTCR